MKINTTWSQADWDKNLEKVWKLSRSFEEILNFGLDHGFITNSDIIHASDIYKDPDKEYDDEEVKEMISSRGLEEIMEIIQNEYSLDEILDELPKDDILDNIDKSDLLDKLDGSWELDQHDEEVKSEYYQECIDECIDQFEEDEKNRINNIRNWPADELHKFLCDVFGVSYYDQNIVNKLKKALSKNNYNVIYE